MIYVLFHMFYADAAVEARIQIGWNKCSWYHCLRVRQREKVYFSIKYYNITYIISESKGGLPEKAKAHQAGHPLLSPQQINST